MKWWLVALILLPHAAGAPVIVWDTDATGTDVHAANGAVVLGEDTKYFDATGNLQQTLPRGDWAGALFSNGWYALDGSQVADSTQPDAMDVSGVLSTGATHRVYDAGQFVREWQSNVCDGGPLVGHGSRDGAVDVAYNGTVAVFHANGTQWSVAPGPIASAHVQAGGMTVVLANGRVSHYDADAGCNGTPAWSTDLRQSVQKTWHQTNTYVQLQEPLIGSRLAAISPTGALLWSIPVFQIKDVQEFDQWTLVAAEQLDWLQSSTGDFAFTQKLQATALAAGQDQVYALGSKLWSIQNGLPDFAVSLEGNEVVVRNLGNVAASFTHGETYRLAPGESVRFPAQTMTVDPDNLVEESDETNNSVTYTESSSSAGSDVVVVPAAPLLAGLLMLIFITMRRR